jgi:hypothetical protein
MHEDAIDYLGKGFDSARFDLAEVNWRLSRAFKPAKPRSRKARKKRD